MPTSFTVSNSQGQRRDPPAQDAPQSSSSRARGRKRTPSPDEGSSGTVPDPRGKKSFLSLADFPELSRLSTSVSVAPTPTPTYTEVLFHPELLPRVKSQSGSVSANPLLEFCLDGGHLKRDKEDSRGEQAILRARSNQDPILDLCSRSPFTFHDLKTLDTLLKGCRHRDFSSLGCDIHSVDQDGNSAMHLLLKYCSRESFPFVFRAISTLMSQSFNVGLVNRDGNTIVNLVHHLFPKDLFGQALEILQFILRALPEEHCPRIVNHRNTANRSLLTHAVEHGDAAVEIARFLLNFGAQVCPSVHRCPSDDIGVHLTKERESSAFTWFLRSHMALDLGQPLLSERLLLVLGKAMAADPVWMRDHVHRVLMSQGYSAQAHGRLFAQIKVVLGPLWNQPQSLRYLSSRQVRQSLRPKTLSDLSVLRHKFTHVPIGILKLLQLE